MEWQSERQYLSLIPLCIAPIGIGSVAKCGTNMPALTNPKHERFAQELAMGKTLDEAYQFAGYKPSRSNASVLKTKKSILDRINELLERSAKNAEITIGSLGAMLIADRNLARELGQSAAAVSAVAQLGKLYGLLIERSENQNVNTNYVVSGEPVDSAEDWEAEHAKH